MSLRSVRTKLHSLFLPLCDMALVNVSMLGALVLRFEWEIPDRFMLLYQRNAPLVTVIMLAVFMGLGVYKSLWKYASVADVSKIIMATLLGDCLLILLRYTSNILLPRSVYILFPMLLIMSTFAVRLSYYMYKFVVPNMLFGNKNYRNVLVVGAGQAGSFVIKELLGSKGRKKPVAIIDDDESKHGKRIYGIPIIGSRENITHIARDRAIDEIIIAIPSLSEHDLRDIVAICKQTKCQIKTLPGLAELSDGLTSVSQIRDVQIEDLLGREPIDLRIEEVCDYLEDRVVLVTGGGGSIGSELCRQIARFRPRRLLIVDIYENNAYELYLELENSYPEVEVVILIASVRDKERMKEIFRQHKPDVVFHAAAHKHVPLMEQNPLEAIKNNIFGTLHVVESANEFGSRHFILISTDKAVNPTNIMGATKRIAEMIIQAFDKISNTKFAAVRFGNVLGSSGSVIPIFKKQIAQGGPITVTHPDTTRYFMTIPEAAQLVLQAGALANGGEVFILNMGRPVRILDLANDLIRLSGLEPGEDIKICFIGLRPGEKVHEELFGHNEKVQDTRHSRIYCCTPPVIDMEQLEPFLTDLVACRFQTREKALGCLQQIIAGDAVAALKEIVSSR